MGFDRRSARLETPKNVLPYPSRHILSQHPHSHPSKWVPRVHQGRQYRQHSKNGWKVHKLHKRLSHSAPYKPHGVGTWKHFFGSKSKKNKTLVIFDPKKGGVSFFDPPPHTPPPPSKAPKNGFQVGGGLGGSGPKTHWGMRLLDKIMILQGFKLTIQPLGVGYAKRAKNTKWGGMWHLRNDCLPQ